jgi:hypothetical protein
VPQFAAFLFLGHDRPLPVLEAALSFARSDPALPLDPEALGDLHALDPQREANLRCWLAGYRPHDFTALAGSLPSSRHASCGSEFARLRASWQRLLAPHTRR